MITVPEKRCPSFHSGNVKGNWTHLVQKNLRQGGEINTVFRLS